MNQEYTRAPHVRPSADTPLHSAAMLIDFDNVTMGIRSNLGQELRNLMDSDIIRGKVAVQRAYADWRRYPQYIVPLSEASIDLIFAPAYGSSKKNATDIRLAIDALELVFTRPEIGTFILLSGDSDFSSLVLKLKEYGKYVIGVGLQESTSDILVQNCDEYYSYNRLSGLTSADEMPTEKHDPWELVEKAVQRMVDRGDVMRSDRLKQVMLEMDSAFDEKTAGFTKFNRFLAEAAHRDLVRMRKGENGQYEIMAGEGKAAAAVDAPPARSSSRSGGRGGRGSGRGGSRGRGRGRGRGGRGRDEATPATKADDGGSEAETEEAPPATDPEVALRSAYDELVIVVAQMYEDGPVRDSMVKRKLLERDASFDEGTLGFSKFSHFLRQAHDEGIVDLEKQDDGNYYLTPASGADAHPAARSEDRAARDRRKPAREGRPERPEPTAEKDDGGGGEDDGDEPEAGPDGAEDPREASALSAAAAAARRTLGRFRRGSRSAPPASGASSDRPGIGPVDVGDEASDSDSDEDEKAETTEEAAPSSRPSTSGDGGGGERPAEDRPAARASLGRYRKGSRGRGPSGRSSKDEGDASRSRIGPVPEEELPASGSDGSSEASGNGAAPAESSAPAATADAPPSPDGGPVDHMIRNYPGVGERTAEALFDRFGDDVFRVIDEDPDRLSEVLSKGRARAVVEARRRERDA